LLLFSLEFLRIPIGLYHYNFSRQSLGIQTSSRFEKSAFFLHLKPWLMHGKVHTALTTISTYLQSHSGLHNNDSRFRLRLYYFFHRFIKELRNEIPPTIVSTIIDSMRDLLPIVAEIPEPEEPETDVLAEAIKDSAFSSQLYLFETTGILCSLLYKNPSQQSAVLLSLVKPLMEDLSMNFQAFRTNGLADFVPIVKVHHVIMALGNIAKGFPDYPNPLPENYVLPPMEVFADMAQAILVCLEAMNVFKPIRDAVRVSVVQPQHGLTLLVDKVCIR